MPKEAPYPVELSEFIARDIGRRFRLPEAHPIEAAELVDFLVERFGVPKIEPRNDVEEDLTFDHPEFQGTLVRIASSSLLTGFIFAQAGPPPPPPPPPCPGFRGTLTATASGTARRTGIVALLLGPGTAILEATAKANLNLPASISAVSLTLCAGCPANCTCLWYPSGIDLPILAVSLVRGFAGLPVGYTVTTWVFQPISATCI